MLQVLIFRFKSQSETHGPGFKIEYYSLDCHGHSNTTIIPCRSVCRNYYATSGTLTSPYYPAPYPRGTDCNYTISLSNGSYLLLSKVNFDLSEPQMGGIRYQVYLEIRDGGSEESPLIGKFRGSSFPSTIKSTQNDLWMR